MDFRIATMSCAALVLLALSGCEAGGNRLRARLELKKGNLSYLAGDHKTALEHYGRAIVHVPALSRAHLNRGYAEVALFRISVDPGERRALADSAVASFERYLQLVAAGHRDGGEMPSTDHIEEHMLTLYLESAQQTKAMALLQARLERHPQDMATLQQLGNLAVGQGDLDAALRWHRRRIELEPESPEGYYALGVMAWQFSYHGRVSDERRPALLDEGLQDVQRALELRPDYYEALIYANLLYREKAKHAASEVERAGYEKLYTEFEARAREVREKQSKKAA